MPYITETQKKRLDQNFSSDVPENAGEINYLITKLVLKYLEGKGMVTYQLINDVVGALEGAKQEFYRRLASEYEEEKIKQNGDVY